MEFLLMKSEWYCTDLQDYVNISGTYDQSSQLKITEKVWCILTRRTFQRGLGNNHLKVRLNVNKEILGLRGKPLKLCYENVHFKLCRAIS